jgi:predicted permease
MCERIAITLFRWWLHLLPSDFRERAADELLEVFRMRLRSARGTSARVRACLLEFGGVAAAAARARFDPSFRAGPRRKTPGGEWLPVETLVQDASYAVRSIARRPGAALLAVLTLGLGIGASTAMFSVVDAVLLRRLPFPDPEEIVSVYTTNPRLPGDAADGWFSYPELNVLREDGENVLSGLALIRSPGSQGMIVHAGDGESERIFLGATDADLFARVLRVTPIAGRVFSEADGPADRLILITEGYWRRRFAADAAVVGRTINFEETPYTILGVLPEEADLPLPGSPAEAWTLWAGDEDWRNHRYVAIGRLAPDVTIERAAARLSSLIAAALPGDHESHAISLVPRKADETRNVRGSLWLLGLASLLLLAVACANVAALLVGAGIEREQELSVRAALGAGRGRLVRQLLTESVLLALMAAGVGVLVAGGATHALVLLAPDGVPRIADASLDPRALAFAAAVASGCGLLFGLMPALSLSRRGLGGSIRSTSRGAIGVRARLQGSLVAAEIALATLLLVGAGLLGRTLIALNRVDLGFAASETLALRVTTPDARLFRGVDMRDADARTEAVDAFYRSLTNPIVSLPGVLGVAITSNLPLSSDRGNNAIAPEGYEGPELIAERRYVSPNFFEVMGMRIVDGRAFSPEEDRPGAPGTVVVSESLARTAWTGQPAIGKHLLHNDRDHIVVGVAADIHDEEVQAGTSLAFYVPRLEAGQAGGSLVIRTQGEARALAEPVRRRVREAEPEVVIGLLSPLSELAADQIASQRYRARLIVVFSSLATLLSLMGVYGVTARNVAARQRELGVRSALGARGNGLMALVLGQALRLAVLGGAAGIAISLLATRSIEAYLWGVERTDPLTLVGVGALLAGASLLSAVAPALRAARVDPMEALRAQ